VRGVLKKFFDVHRKIFIDGFKHFF
jgi:hypothetical protein